jgi:ATP-dependent exoDNAse (exonuclease V) alpha subunit
VGSPSAPARSTLSWTGWSRTVSLQGEGFKEVATCDRLLADLDHRQEQLDPWTVLVDEAGMVGSRKLARLRERAHQAQAKVVLVGDDRQLAPIDAGGGFRALRLRLGASELVGNRRQQQAWEGEALDLVRSGLVEEAVDGDQAHDRVILPRSYLDGRGRGEPNRRVDLAYATSGHRAQG